VGIDETVRAIDGVLSSHPERWLACAVAFDDKVSGSVIQGKEPVSQRLRELVPVGEVRMTVDVGRGAAEWQIEGLRPVAAAFDVDDGVVTNIRLYAGNALTDDGRDVAAARLTRRELTIALMVASGMSNADVSRELVVTVKTVEFHLRNVFRKLGVMNRTQLASVIRPIT
jgi:DNA-binding CsgD family transcriptional regulator